VRVCSSAPARTVSPQCHGEMEWHWKRRFETEREGVSKALEAEGIEDESDASQRRAYCSSLAFSRVRVLSSELEATLIIGSFRPVYQAGPVVALNSSVHDLIRDDEHDVESILADDPPALRSKRINDGLEPRNALVRATPVGRRLRCGDADDPFADLNVRFDRAGARVAPRPPDFGVESRGGSFLLASAVHVMRAAARMALVDVDGVIERRDDMALVDSLDPARLVARCGHVARRESAVA